LTQRCPISPYAELLGIHADRWIAPLFCRLGNTGITLTTDPDMRDCGTNNNTGSAGAADGRRTAFDCLDRQSRAERVVLCQHDNYVIAGLIAVAGTVDRSRVTRFVHSAQRRAR
jgi:hypothetical protein